MSRKTEIRSVLEGTLTVNQDNVIEGIGEASELIDQKIDEFIIEEKEFEKNPELKEIFGEELL